MSALRASYSINAATLTAFNGLFPAGKRSEIIENSMNQIISLENKKLEALALEFNTHPDFQEARETVAVFEVVTLKDGI